jgi:4-hydroxybenzoate polyprenyltransferase
MQPSLQPVKRNLLDELQARRPKARADAQPDGALAAWLEMLRVHQWAKNLLLFVPLIAAHRLREWPLLVALLVAFFAFSFGASALYIINDVIDLPSDRLHFRKRLRPLASGRFSIATALGASAFLLCTSLAVSALLPLPFFAAMLVYLATSTAYTFFLKKKLIVDVLCLAGLYTLRILAGGAAIGLAISFWLLVFSMFLFLSLAFVKRYSELAVASRENGGQLVGRNYLPADLDMLRSVGPASGYLAVLVLCLYLNDPKSAVLYNHPKALWLLCPMVLYWITRIWFLAQRDQMHSDPMVFALTDTRSVVTGLAAAVIVAAAALL